MAALNKRIARRIGTTPQERGSLSNATCPDMFELDDGSYSVMGTDRTEELRDMLPDDVVLAPGARIVVVTRKTLVHAKKDVPDE